MEIAAINLRLTGAEGSGFSAEWVEATCTPLKAGNVV